VAGIELEIHPTFWILLAYVLLFGGGWLGVVWVSTAFGCVVLHELGHALAARFYGIGTRRIRLYPLGGVAQLERMPRRTGPELLIATAGPAVNFALAGVLALVLGAGVAWDPGADRSEVAGAVRILIAINLALGLFNLIPAFPMDGGRMLRALLSGWLGRLRATEVAVAVSQGLALGVPLLLLVYGQLSLWHLLLAGFVYLAARSEYVAERWSAGQASGRRWVDPARIWSRPAGVESRAPAGYRWVRRGPGLWQLVSIAGDEVS
jgi:Zn-dependent protease